VHKPHNLSAILRTCDAVGVLEAHAVNPTGGVPTFNETSGGSHKWVYLRVHEGIQEAFRYLKERGFRVYATALREDAQDFREVDYTKPTCVLLGAEKWGVSEEALALAEAGHREIVITGINLAQYGLDLPERPGLADLLSELLSVKGVRYRLTSLNPEGLTPELLSLFAREPRLCPYLHMPLQSGDDRVLSAMGRAYTAAEYAEKARKFLQTVPKATLGADVMVGFPGEDELSFAKTVELLEGLEPLNLHIFRFSPRPGTPAAKFSKQVSKEEAARRSSELATLAQGWSLKARARFLGTPLELLVEEKEGPCWVGHTENYIRLSVRESAPLERGTIVPVKLVRIEGNLNEGVVLDRAQDRGDLPS
ncbi:MAG: TrmH family RNA methyltransferase, partial [Candidatus Bipolaricaulaceae bacterium]